MVEAGLRLSTTAGMLQQAANATRQLQQVAAATTATTSTIRTFSEEALVVLWQPEELDPLQPKVDGAPPTSLLPPIRVLQ
jgi:hypothetical protein